MSLARNSWNAATPLGSPGYTNRWNQQGQYNRARCPRDAVHNVPNNNMEWYIPLKLIGGELSALWQSEVVSPDTQRTGPASCAYNDFQEPGGEKVAHYP